MDPLLLQSVLSSLKNVSTNRSVQPSWDPGPPISLPLANELWFRVLAVSIYGVLTGLALIGNTLFCVVIWRSQKLHTVTNLLVSNLAVANLIFTLLHPPQFIQRYITRTEWNLGTMLCKACSSAVYVTATASFYLMALVALDRWLAVFRKTRRLNRNSALVLLALVWLLSFALSSPYFYFFKVIKDEPKIFGIGQNARCSLSCSNCKALLQYVATGCQFALPLLILVPCYTHLVIFLWTQPLVGNRSKQREQAARARKRMAVLTLLAIVVTLVVCWGPLYLVSLLHYFLPFANNLTFLIVGNIWASVAVCLTPVLYLINGSFREELVRLLHCLRPGQGRDSTWVADTTTIHKNAVTVNVENADSECSVPLLEAPRHDTWPPNKKDSRVNDVSL